jgi:hypothetical protein
MSGIVIRCPHCGTTQTTLGECEACHEATTRWFCSNHEPGLWLDAPLCPTCGARPGVPGSRPTPTPTRSRAPTPPRSTPPPRRTPTREETYAPDSPEPEPEVWSGPVFAPGDPRNRDPRFSEAPDAWHIDPSVVFPTAVRVVSVFGCLRRLVMIVLILLVLFAIGFFSLFGGFVFGHEPVQRDGVGDRGASVTAVGERRRDSVGAATRSSAPPSRRVVSPAP